MTEPKIPPTPRLSKEAVVDRALELADANGLEALTIRKLATELGVTPMALYWHFRSKEELLGGLVERVWSEIDVDVDPAAAWPDQLRALLESLLAVLRAHPAASKLLLDFDKQTRASMRAAEVSLEILLGVGFDPEIASGIVRNALWTGIMLVMSDPGADWLTDDEHAEHMRMKQISYATLPPASFPRLVECAVPMTSFSDPEAHYELGVSLFIAGVEALARRRTAGGAGPTEPDVD
ncbi:MAG TPA: TetR family transcriptional regulator [Trebonia sp.]|nr:TetR family transcriptional regulator [Trebonia sp.]